MRAEQPVTLVSNVHHGLERIVAKAFEDASHLGIPRKCTGPDLLAMAREAF